MDQKELNSRLKRVQIARIIAMFTISFVLVPLLVWLNYLLFYSDLPLEEFLWGGIRLGSTTTGVVACIGFISSYPLARVLIGRWIVLNNYISVSEYRQMWKGKRYGEP